MKAVRFDEYGGIDVLKVLEVERPSPARGEVLVRVKAAGINPGETSIRVGRFAKRWPSTFPSGQGSDLAGTVEAVGDGVTAFAPGDDVLGWTDKRASHAEYAVAPAEQLIRRPPEIPWEVAGSLFVAGTTGWATVEAVGVTRGETVAVSAAAGGVGSISAQLAVHRGATVLGLASAAHHDWLKRRGIVPIAYGEGAAARIRAAAPAVDAFIDTFGSGYVELALELGVKPERIDTIIDFDAVTKHPGVMAKGSAEAASAEVLANLVALIRSGALEIPIARTYPLDRVRDAFADLERRHTRGKIVLIP